MKVLFECETCGHRWEPKTKLVEHGESRDPRWMGGDIEPCPVCLPPELTYGPITVDMVAEMLYTASALYPAGSWPGMTAGSTEDTFKDEARAVIRLLNDTYCLTVAYPLSNPAWTDIDWHAKLLELAKDG